MAHTKTQPAPAPDLADIDEALHHTSRAVERNDHWWKWTDQLLDERNRLRHATPSEKGNHDPRTTPHHH